MSIGQLLAGLRAFSFRFLFISVVPTVALLATILLLALSGAPRRQPDLVAGLDRIQHLTAYQVALLVIAGVVLAMILNPMQFSMIQFLEGYWGPSPLAVRAAVLATRRYDKRLKAWQKAMDKAMDEDALRYLSNEYERERVSQVHSRARDALPRSERRMPTRLGNVLRAAEDAAGDRYGLNAVLISQHLHRVLRGEIASQLDDSRLQLDVSVRFCLVWLMATAACLVMLAPFGAWLWVPAATYLLAWLSYRAACSAAAAYGGMLAVAVDLHRFDMLTALHQQLPSGYRDEVASNRKLMKILAGEHTRSSELDLPEAPYRHPPEQESPRS